MQTHLNEKRGSVISNDPYGMQPAELMLERKDGSYNQGHKVKFLSK
jgi:hypothetical protein